MRKRPSPLSNAESKVALFSLDVLRSLTTAILDDDVVPHAKPDGELGEIGPINTSPLSSGPSNEAERAS